VGCVLPECLRHVGFARQWRGPTYDIEFNPSVFNLSNLPFGAQATTVDFTKFKVVADKIVCP
jgi:hypothetical protein